MRTFDDPITFLFNVESTDCQILFLPLIKDSVSLYFELGISIYKREHPLLSNNASKMS